MPCEPTVDMAPKSLPPACALRLAEAYSTFTFAQSQPSSSAASMASAVAVPWPISAWGMRTVTLLSGSITRKAVISRAVLVPSARIAGCRAARAAPAASATRGTPIIRPPAAEAPIRTARRFTSGAFMPWLPC